MKKVKNIYILEDASYEQRDSGLKTLKYHPVDNIVDGLRIVWVLFGLDSSTYEHFNQQIQQAWNITLQKCCTQLMEAVGVTDGRYERALSYKKKVDDGKFGYSYKRLE